MRWRLIAACGLAVVVASCATIIGLDDFGGSVAAGGFGATGGATAGSGAGGAGQGGDGAGGAGQGGDGAGGGADCNVVFVTENQYGQGTGGNEFVGLAGGDALCNELAQKESLPGTFTAWLSAPGSLAIDRIGPGPWCLLDGTTVFPDKSYVLMYGPAVPINIPETGAAGGLPASQLVWTGTNADGTLGNNHCNGWTGTGEAHSGSLETGPSWTEKFGQGTCAVAQRERLYCFED